MKMRLRLLTLNVAGINNAWFESRAESLRTGLQGLQPDIICLQEVAHWLNGELHDQAAEIGSTVGLKYEAFSPYGNPEETRSRQSGGLAILSRWPFKSMHSFKLPCGRIAAQDERVVLVAQILAPTVEIKVATTHLSWQAAEAPTRLQQTYWLLQNLNLGSLTNLAVSSPTQPASAQQASTLPAPTLPAPTLPAPTLPAAPARPAPTLPAPARPAPTLPAPARPAPTLPAPARPAPGLPEFGPIVTGDFNATEDEPAIRLISSCLQDAYRQIHPDVPGLTWVNANPWSEHYHMPDRRLDYVFYPNSPGHVQLLAAEIALNSPIPVYPSDHFGVCVDFDLQFSNCPKAQ